MILNSIRARLTATFSLCLTVLMIITISVMILYSRYSVERNADGILASALKRAVIESSSPEEPYSPKELIEEEREDFVGSSLVLSIIDKNGKVIGKSQKDAPESFIVDRRIWRLESSRLRNGDTLIVAVPWVKTRNELRSHAVMLLWLGAFVVVITSIGAWILVGRTLGPISALAKQARSSSADDLRISLKAPSGDREMLELVGTLNGLLDRITRTTAAKGRFYSAASHELRTPLQALSGHLELALNRDRTKEEYKEAVEEAYRQTRRLIALSRSLLLLYQLDSSTTSPPKEPVDLVEVCKQWLIHFEPLSIDRSLQVNRHTSEIADIVAPPAHIDMLVRNLVENAVKYTPERGRIDLNIADTAEGVRLEIANDCAVPLDLKPEEVFEPFTRPDSSRNSRTGGTGLGLAICKSIADANGWQFHIDPSDSSVRAVLIIPTLYPRKPR